MNFLKILQGKKLATSSEILSEIKEINQKVSDSQDRLKSLDDELMDAWADVQGGGSSKEYKKLQSEKNDIRTDIEMFSRTSDDLRSLYSETLRNEKAAMVDEIRAAIDEEKKHYQEIKVQYLQASAVSDALAKLMAPPRYGYFTPAGNEGIRATGKEREEHYNSTYNEILDANGGQSILHRIHVLRSELEALQKG